MAWLAYGLKYFGPHTEEPWVSAAPSSRSRRLLAVSIGFFFTLSIPLSPAGAARDAFGDGTEVAAAMSPVERALAARIASDHNTVRAAAGLDPLLEFDALAPYAGGNGEAMRTSGELGHSEIGTLLDDFPTNMWAAENSLVMFDPASDAVGHWMQSGSHAANLMAPRATHLWVDVRCAADGRMWVTTQFVSRAASESETIPGEDSEIAAAASSDLRCPVAVGPFGSADDFVAQQYADFLGRPADSAGQGYWSALLNTQTATPSEVVLAFLNSDEFSGRIRPQAEAGLLASTDFPTPSQVDRWRQMPPPQALVADADTVRVR